MLELLHLEEKIGVLVWSGFLNPCIWLMFSVFFDLANKFMET
jgi:hypothetical protein